MKWRIDRSKAICPQICEQICLEIAYGNFKPNEKILSVREVALDAGVNPNTVQNSFNELERQGILYSIRGSGWFVAEDISLAKETLKQIINEKTAAFFTEMSNLGLSYEEIKEYVKEWHYERNSNL